MSRYCIYRMAPDRRYYAEGSDDLSCAKTQALELVEQGLDSVEVWDRIENKPVFAVWKENGRIRQKA